MGNSRWHMCHILLAVKVWCFLHAINVGMAYAYAYARSWASWWSKGAILAPAKRHRHMIICMRVMSMVWMNHVPITSHHITSLTLIFWIRHEFFAFFCVCYFVHLSFVFSFVSCVSGHSDLDSTHNTPLSPNANKFKKQRLMRAKKQLCCIAQ
jgi:hypothetical protein